MWHKKFLCVLLVFNILLMLYGAAFASEKSELLKKAFAGDPQAQTELGISLLNDEGEKKDVILALRYFRKAAEKNNAEAQYYLGFMHENALGTKKDYREAAKWYKKSAAQGFTKADVALGNLYYNGRGVIEDDNQAEKYWTKAADKGSATAMYNLGVLYEYKYKNSLSFYSNDSDPQARKTAIEWYKKAADNGYENAVAKLSDMGVQYTSKAAKAQKAKKKSSSTKYYYIEYKSTEDMIKQAEGGKPSAQYDLGEAYFKGTRGLKQDYNQAKFWFQKAAEQGLNNAQYTLGMMYYQGAGMEKDYVQSEYWLSKAAENGDENTKKHLETVRTKAEAQRKAEARKAAEAKAAARAALKRNPQPVTSTPAFEQIINEFELDPETANARWKDKIIYIEGMLDGIDTETFKGNPAIALAKQGFDKGGYAFIFDSLSIFQDFSSLVAAKMSVGRKIKLKGQISKITRSSNDVIIVLCINSEFAGKIRNWRCSKCGQIYTKITDGMDFIDMIASGARCSYGGQHDWRSID